MAIIYKMNKTNMITMFPRSTPPKPTRSNATGEHTEHPKLGFRSLIYTYRVPHSFWKE